MSRLRKQQGRAEESQRLREEAMTRLDDNAEWMQQALFQHLMAGVLTELEEYRRAIPFCEKMIELERECADPVSMADMLCSLRRIALRPAARGYNRRRLVELAPTSCQLG